METKTNTITVYINWVPHDIKLWSLKAYIQYWKANWDKVTLTK